MRVLFFYGWVVVAVAFVTMAVGVNARTAFSLFFPPIFGVLGLAAGMGAGLGPLMAGVLYDPTGRYTEAFSVAIGCCTISAGAIWLAAPRKVRMVAGRLDRLRVAVR